MDRSVPPSSRPQPLELLSFSALNPYGVSILVTTRRRGASTGPYAAGNLALHVGDDPAAVAANRRYLHELLGAEPLWLNQIHGNSLLDADTYTPPSPSSNAPTADGALTVHRDRWLALLTADCLPVVLARLDGTRVAVVHAGWRGIASGILQHAAARMESPFIAWIGPSICGRCYEVGPEVIAALSSRLPLPTDAVTPKSTGKFHLNLALVALSHLKSAGATEILTTPHCTYHEPLWYSHRRDGPYTGRFATLVAITGAFSPRSEK
ncbi:MAG: peptidoglycan editing factor PgeF [Hydrogenophilus sp.]|nr:peptidoglycan editing factor PgeF [Hydrogenophilus sp.]